MVDAIVSFAVQKIGDFLIQEVVFLRGVRDDVEWLRNELRYMRGFTKDAEEKQGGDHLVRQWVSEITDLSYDAVDILESFTLKIQRSPPHRSKFIDCVKTCACICNKEADGLYYIGKEIKCLRERLLDISRRREAYGITNINHDAERPSRGPTNRSLRRTTSYAEEHVVGFEDEVENLIAQLLKEEPQRCTVSIYGMGGLGKTTLARKLYKATEVVNKFQYRAWVCVSQEYRTRDLLQSIIRSTRGGLTTEQLEKMTREELERHLREFLIGCRYLVVVDDVWHREAWESLRRAFPDNCKGSRVIMTTRNKEIAMRADDRGFAHELRFLRPRESWDLFYEKVFPRDGVNYCPPIMERLGKEMVEKCRGLPLAIIVLGGLLSHKNEPEEWYKVRESIWRHLQDDSVEISLLLTLSYNDLSPEIKQCFLYLGMFPEDYVINAKKLVQLWMAEDFIPHEERRMEDLAEDYLNELINRSLVQVATRFWEKVVGCSVHDLMRDLAVQKAMEGGFLDIFEAPRCSSVPSGRRHAITQQVQRYFSINNFNLKLRSLVFFNPDRECPQVERLTFLCRNLKLLRVLDLENISFAHPEGELLPDAIGELIYLKFLGLTNTYINTLPSSIGNLKSLQTLRVNGDFICTLPPEICELKQLRHLLGYFQGCFQIDTLVNLQTLKYLCNDQWTKISTVNLTNLRELALYMIDESSASMHCLETIARLQNLVILFLSSNDVLPPLQPLSSCHRLLKLLLNGKIKNSQLKEGLPQSLTMLILEKSMLEEDPMPTLEMLPNLRSLELGSKSYKGNKMVCSATGFRQLEVLRIMDMSNLKEWQVEEGAMPIIKSLGIYNCSNLQTIPERLRYVPSIPGPEHNYGTPEFRYNPF